MLAACEEMATLPRREGETAFPALGDILVHVREHKQRTLIENRAQRNQREIEEAFWLHIDFLKSSEGWPEQQALDSIRRPGWTGSARAIPL